MTARRALGAVVATFAAAAICRILVTDAAVGSAESGDAAPWRSAVAVLFGGQRGRMETCGCTSPQLGGVARLAALIGRVRRGSTGAAAIQIGTPLGGSEGPILAAAKRSVFDQFFATCRCEFVDSDRDGPASPRPDEDRRLGPWRRIPIPGGAAHVWNGVVEGEADADRAVDAVKRLPSAVPGGVVIVAAQADAENLARLRGRLDAAGVDVPALIVDLRDGRGASGLPRLAVGRAATVSGLDRGRGAIVLRRRPDLGADALECEPVALGPEFDSPATPEVRAVGDALKEYGERVSRRRATDELSRVVSSDTDPFAGAAACRACHPREHEAWSSTRHARAYETLDRHGRGGDPECVVCHTVGWTRTADGRWLGSPSGFAAPGVTTEVAGVGCECCHGPGQSHVDRPRRPGAAAAVNWTARPTLESCVACHDSESSPGFRERFESRDLSAAAHDVGSRR